MITVYGIPNCDTVKKALRWLNDNGISYEFHNYKKQGIDEATIKSWLKQHELDLLINKKGSTYKNFTDEQKKQTESTKTAIALMISNSSVIKRPVIQVNKNSIVGFSEEVYATTFLK
jgi:arsenate reductase (glutaredoxin)